MKRYVLFWMIFLVLNFVLSYLIAEPYPTFIMPGFGRVFHQGNNIISYDEPRVRVQFSDSTTRDINYQQLFEDLRTVAPTAVMKNIFTTSHVVRTSVDTTATSFYHRMKQLRFRMQTKVSQSLPALYGRAMQDRASAPETVAWLKKRIHAIVPEKEAREVFIRWSTRTYDLRDTTMVFISEIPTDSVRISLAAENGGVR